jgi:hypothetical protein
MGHSHQHRTWGPGGLHGAVQQPCRHTVMLHKGGGHLNSCQHHVWRLRLQKGLPQRHNVIVLPH